MRVLTRLLSVFDDDAASAHALGELALCDPALALHLLVSAGPFAPGIDPAQALSMDACVSALGFDMLHALVYRLLGRQFRTDPALYPQAVLGRTWAQSILCAELAAGLAQALKRPSAPARLAGLLHLLGQLLLLQSRTEAYGPMLKSFPRNRDLLRAERERFGTAHDIAGAMWLERCGLPGFAPEAARLLYEPLERLVDAPFEVRAVRIASEIAEQGLNPETGRAALKMLGIEPAALEKLVQDALASARANPAGINIDDASVARAVADELLVSADLSLQVPVRTDPSVNQSLPEALSAFAESGANWTSRQALSDAADQQDALIRIRRLTRLLTGFGPQVFFLAAPDGKRLIGVALDGNPRGLSELAVTVEGSSSLLARAARERSPVRAAGAALDQGAAIDLGVARMMGARELLCLPMVHDSALVGVTVIALPLDSQEASEPGTVLARLAALAAETLLRAGRRAGSDERARAELTERFRAVGKRVVHEAGNPLSIVKNYLKLLGDKLPDRGQFREELMILNEELDRVARIVQRMADPFAVELEEPSRLDLNSMVHELMILCRETIFAERGIEVVQQLDAQLPLLQSDVGAVKQVALNILTNAAEAMPNGGRLGVMTADSVNLGGELFVLLQISDTGSGLTPELMERLFTPGITTKGEGHAGIGLSVSFSILQRLGGRVLCRSSVGRGTIFLILLPRRIYMADSDSGASGPEAAV